jgi:glycosyltransferase involved in cell wall biosynthesis
MTVISNSGPVVIISHDLVGTHMAGPGVRYFHLAQVLAREFEVILAVPVGSTLEKATSVTVQPYSTGQDAALEAVIRQARAVFVPAVTVSSHPVLFGTRVPIIIDGYDPFLAETLAVSPKSARAQQAILAQACLLGDFFVCASERQRDWWLGYLEAMGRINEHTHGADPSLRQLVDLVPFGLPDGQPQHTRAVVKGIWPSIASTDRVVLWGGGLWPWLDPLTAVRAMGQIARLRSDVRLIFPGTQHPNPAVAQGPTHTETARTLACKLGLIDTAVFFGEWVAYEDWPNVLLESDVAVTLSQGDTLETRLAFRSRVLDYVWAGLPIVTTLGDATSDLITSLGLGRGVNFQSGEEVAAAIMELLAVPREALDQRFADARRALTWDRAAQPLAAFCRAARRAADKEALGVDLGNAYYLDEVARWRSSAQEQTGIRGLRRWWHSLRARLRRPTSKKDVDIA